MKLVRFGTPGSERVGVLDAEGRVRDASAVLSKETALTADLLATVRHLLEQDALPEEKEPGRLLSPIAKPGKVVGIGLNYRDHAAESGVDPPPEPVVFLKPGSSMAGPYDDIELPPGSTHTDWEVELGVVLGTALRRCDDPKSALSAVAGYVTANDVTERDLQFNHGPTWTKGKSCDTFSPVGPWLVTPDEVGDPERLSLQLWVNGALRQSSSTEQMIFGIAEVLMFVSGLMTLEPGDLVLTGTPGGVAMGRPDPKPYLRAGDVVELEVDGLGRQRSLVVES